MACGTRVSFQTMLDYLEGGETLDDSFKQFPGVSRENAIAALDEAKALVLARFGRPDACGMEYNKFMTQPAFELLQKALTLSEEERAELAGSLIDSLDAKVDEGAESAWHQEIARRIEGLDSGKAKTVPWQEVQRRISTNLTHGK